LEPADNPGVALAQRLRTLRTESAGKPLTQGTLAAALGVTAQSVSSWEREEKVTVIPHGHLRSYARFFAVDRFEGDGKRQLVDLNELSDDERRQVAELEHQLEDLRNAALGESGVRRRDETAASAGSAEFPGLHDRFWRFPYDRPITIVCAQLPEGQVTARFTDPRDPDFVSAYTYSDLGAVVEVYGHLRAVNPNSDVRIRPARSALDSNDYTDNLVLLGGVDFNHVTQAVLDLIDIPVEQESRDTPDDPGSFRVAGEEFRPDIVKSKDGTRRTLVRDVAHFYRGPNPYNKLRTVTICNGMFGRGVEGAVRATTDPKFRDRNAEYVRARLENNGSVSLLFWVSIPGSGTALPPDWTQEGTVLYESS